MVFYVEPYIGAKPLTFGMDKCAVKHILGDAQKTFRRSQFAKGDTEMYSECFVEYDTDGRCASIEFFGTACLVLKGINLFSLSCYELRSLLNVVDDDEGDGEGGFISDTYGLSVYAPDECDDPRCSPESISVFKQV